MTLSYDELRLEPCWRAQVVPPALVWIAEQLRDYYGQNADEIGSPGDNRHLRGGHRSRRWIRESEHCTDDEYTVTYPADRLGDEDWYSAIDIDPGSRAKLADMCRRLDAACRAGEFPEISEWFGNLGGDDRVDGWNNVTKRVAVADPSHLGHGHITLLRKYANDMALMRRLLATLIGDPLMPLNDGDAKALIYRVESTSNMKDTTAVGASGRPEPNLLVLAVKRIEVKLGASEARELALASAVKALADLGGADAAPIVAAVNRVGAELGVKIAELEADNEALRAELRAYREAEAAADRARADVLDGDPATG